MMISASVLLVVILAHLAQATDFSHITVGESRFRPFVSDSVSQHNRHAVRHSVPHRFGHRMARTQAHQVDDFKTVVSSDIHVNDMNGRQFEDSVKSWSSVDEPADASFPFDKIVIFGDSLSCSGNYFTLINAHDNRPPIYRNNVYADGLLWYEIMIQQLLGGQKISVTNFAYAWSTAGAYKQSQKDIDSNAPEIPNLLEQIQFWLKYDRPMGRTLYVIWTGGNDYIRSFGAKPSVFIKEGMETILAKDPNASFLIPNIIPGDLLPMTLDKIRSRVAMKMDAHTEALKVMKSQFPSEHNIAESRVTLVDITNLIRSMCANPPAYGFEDTMEACVKDDPSTGEFKILCNDPSRRIFLDQVHLSSAVHAYIAQAMLGAIRTSIGYNESI